MDLQKPFQITQEIIIATLTHYPDTPSTYVAIDDQVYFHRQLIANPVNP